MNLHDDDSAKHNHETTLECRCAAEQGEMMVRTVGRSRRISFWTVPGVVGRNLLKLGCDVMRRAE